jgi:hypothetical protein
LNQVAVVVVMRRLDELDEKFCAVRLVHTLAKKRPPQLYPQWKRFATDLIRCLLISILNGLSLRNSA